MLTLILTPPLEYEITNDLGNQITFETNNEQPDKSYFEYKIIRTHNLGNDNIYFTNAYLYASW